LINTSLIDQVMNRAFNSTGSNIFFEFGEQKEYLFANGQKTAQKEWSIWLSWTSWRITHHNKYILGSDENCDINIQEFLDKLLGKRFRYFLFISEFLDIELHFEDGYKVSTFFNSAFKNQWLIFLPNDCEIVIDCSTKESINLLQFLSKQINIQSQFSNAHLSIVQEKIDEILYNKDTVSQLILSNNWLIDLGTAAWRLLKNNDYLLGRLDYYFGCKEGKEKELRKIILDLIGKSLKNLSINFNGVDIRLDFEDGYILEIFTHCKSNPWKISHKGDVCLSAKIDI